MGNDLFNAISSDYKYIKYFNENSHSCFKSKYYLVFAGKWKVVELNPFMLYFIKKDVVLSMVVKYVMTASALIFILIHKNFRVFGGLKVGKLIYGIFFMYSGVVVFEVVSCFRIMGFTFLLSIF